MATMQILFLHAWVEAYRDLRRLHQQRAQHAVALLGDDSQLLLSPRRGARAESAPGNWPLACPARTGSHRRWSAHRPAPCADPLPVASSATGPAGSPPPRVARRHRACRLAGSTSPAVPASLLVRVTPR